MPQAKYKINVPLLKAWIKEHEGSQACLCRASGVSPSHLVKLLRDEWAVEGVILRLERAVGQEIKILEPKKEPIVRQANS